MPVTAPPAERPRRSQQERRAATKRALLDASLACLIDEGYAGLSTRRVAARAGVSAATQRFYFPNRTAFVAAVVEELAIVLRRQIAALELSSIPRVERFGACLDQLWAICNGPMFQIMSELSAAARHDEDAREGLLAAERVVTRQIAQSASELFPGEIEKPEFRLLVDLATSSMRGLAMFQPVTEQRQIDLRWRAIRERVTEMYAELVGEARGAGT